MKTISKIAAVVITVVGSSGCGDFWISPTVPEFPASSDQPVNALFSMGVHGDGMTHDVQVEALRALDVRAVRTDLPLEWVRRGQSSLWAGEGYEVLGIIGGSPIPPTTP